MSLVTTRPHAKPADIPLRIYSNPLCPFAHRARLAAVITGVKYELVNVHLKEKPQWFLDEINPFGKVPVIEHDGHIIRESAVTFDYIDEVFGGRKLWPSDSYKKAQSKLVLNDFGEMFVPNYYKYYFGTQDEDTPKAILKFLQSVEKVISEYGGPFIMGNEVSAIDLLIWPWFERLIQPGIESVRRNNDNIAIPDVRAVFNDDNVPLFVKWEQAMKELDVVKKTGLPAETYIAFGLKMKELGGVHDYSTLKIDGVKIYTK